MSHLAVTERKSPQVAALPVESVDSHTGNKVSSVASRSLSSPKVMVGSASESRSEFWDREGELFHMLLGDGEPTYYPPRQIDDK